MKLKIILYSWKWFYVWLPNKAVNKRGGCCYTSCRFCSALVPYDHFWEGVQFERVDSKKEERENLTQRKRVLKAFLAEKCFVDSKSSPTSPPRARWESNETEFSVFWRTSAAVSQRQDKGGMRLLPLKEQHGIMGVYCPPTACWHLPAGFRPGLNVVTVRLKSWGCQHAPNPTSPVSHDSRGVTHGRVALLVWKLATIPVGFHTTLFILSPFPQTTRNLCKRLWWERAFLDKSLSQNKFHLKRGFFYFAIIGNKKPHQILPPTLRWGCRVVWLQEL